MLTLAWGPESYALRHPSEIDDLHHEDSDPGNSWAGGEIELAEERPATALSGDPSHRKWMLIGAGGAGLVTVLAVVLLTRGSNPAEAGDQASIEPDLATEQQAAIEPVDALEPAPEPAPEPAVEAKVAPSEAAPPKQIKPTLAATSRTAVSVPSKPVVKKAPPAPAAAGSVRWPRIRPRPP